MNIPKTSSLLLGASLCLLAPLSIHAALTPTQQAHEDYKACMKSASTAAEKSACKRALKRALRQARASKDAESKEASAAPSAASEDAVLNSVSSKSRSVKRPRPKSKSSTKRKRRFKSTRSLGIGSIGVSQPSNSYGKAASGRASGKSLSASKRSTHSISSRLPVARPPAARPPKPGAQVKVNGVIQTSKQTTSTFAADVDTGSYTFARGTIQAGQTPQAAAVRPEEFINYFTYDYAKPAKGDFAVHLEAAPSPFATAKNTYVMQVGVQGKTLTASTRKPVHLTFLVDVSGSMSARNKLPLAKDALKILLKSLRKTDTVALATYASGSKIVLEPTSVQQSGKIVAALDKLTPGGSTAMSNGLTNAYKLALSNFKRDHVNRVIVLSDGDANLGPRNHQEILKTIKKYVDEGVTLSTIGLGRGNYRDRNMEQLANKGNGNYYYIDSAAEARKVFESQVDGTLQVIAKDMKIQVEFNPKQVKSFRLIGYENRAMKNEDFRKDEVDAGELGAGHQVTALYEIETYGKPKGQVATVRLRHKQPDGYKATESMFRLMPAGVHTKIGHASKDFQFATAAAAYAEILRGSPYAKKLSYALVKEVARPAVGKDKSRKEFITLVDKSKAMKKATASATRPSRLASAFSTSTTSASAPGAARRSNRFILID